MLTSEDFQAMFRHEYLLNKSFDGLNLRQFETTGSTFESCLFTDCIMPQRGGRLDAAFFYCTFRNCDLRQARLTCATFRECKFYHCLMDNTPSGCYTDRCIVNGEQITGWTWR